MNHAHQALDMNSEELAKALTRAKEDLFPFTVFGVHTSKWWRNDWFPANRAMLTEKYGRRYYTGRQPGGYETSWGYFELDLRVESETEATILSYGMKSMVTGGRGLLEEEIPLEPGSVDFTQFILERTSSRIRSIWEQERDRQQRVRDYEEQNALHIQAFGVPMEPYKDYL